MSSPDYGWSGNERVPTEDGRDFLFDMDEPEEVPRVSGFHWPCEESPALWVEVATEEEAVEAATYSREQFMIWLAGGGLHPVSVFYRWAIASLFLRLDPPAPVVKLAMGMQTGGAGLTRMERHVFEAIKPEEPWKRTAELVEAALNDSALRGRYHKREDFRSLGELLEWISGMAVETPPGVEEEPFHDDIREIARGSMRLICRWITGSGTGALQVLQRFYALIFYRYKVTAQDMTGHDLAALVRQGRATFCEETSRWFEEPGEILLGYRPKSSSGQKSAASSDVYRENAALHCPRRQLNGTAGLDREEREAAAAADEGQQKTAEARAARIAHDWETAAAWVAFIGTAAERKERFGDLTPDQMARVEELREREAEEFRERIHGSAD